MIQDAQKSLFRVAHKHVLCDRKVSKKTRVLVHDGDAAMLRVQRRTRVNRLPFEVSVSSGRRMDTGEDLYAGALTGSIFPQKGEHFARTQFKRNSLDRYDSAKRLCHIMKAAEYDAALHDSFIARLSQNSWCCFIVRSP